MHIDLWFDVTCPWSYLGIRHWRQALSSFDHRDEVEIALHAFFLDPELDSAREEPRRVYLMNEGELTYEEAVALDERLEKLGRAEGVVFDFEKLIVAPSSYAHRVINAARIEDYDRDTLNGPDSMQLKLAEALGRAHFEMALDISNSDVVIGCAQDLGLDAQFVLDALTDPHTASDVFSDFQIGVQMGIDRVPTALIDRKFVVQDHQTVPALGNILATAWANTGKEEV